jgi:hypothetical protein
MNLPDSIPQRHAAAILGIKLSERVHILISVSSLLFVATIRPILNTSCFVIVNFYSLVIGMFILICANDDAHASNTSRVKYFFLPHVSVLCIYKVCDQLIFSRKIQIVKQKFQDELCYLCYSKCFHPYREAVGTWKVIIHHFHFRT